MYRQARRCAYEKDRSEPYGGFDGRKKLAEKLCSEVAEAAGKLARRPCLAAVLVGTDPASQIYVRNKERDCQKCGIDSRRYDRDEAVSEAELLSLIADLNADDTVDGILVQLPLPEHICERNVINAIDPDKDVDAFHPINVGKMVTGQAHLLPCTPAGIMEMLREYGISPDGKHCVIVGRSNIVGRPMGMLMLNADATVTYCHRRTRDLAALTRMADILIVAAGCPRLITGDMVRSGAVVIDVAMNRDSETGRFFGDVCFNEVEPKAAFITPVPGGVGPMTRAQLMRNILEASRSRQS